MGEFNVLSIMEQIPTEAAAYEFMEKLRWSGTPECPHCGNTERCYFLTPANGKSRATSTGAESQRRLWKCGACRKKFSVLTGTVMHGTKIPVRTWVLVMFEMCCCKNGVSAREIQRRYSLTPKSAWFLTHRIREAMRNDKLVSLGGDGAVIVADETWVGGRPKNKHRQGRPTYLPGGGRGRAGAATKKIPVLTLIDRSSGEARSAVIRDVNGATLRKAIAEQVDMAGSTLNTDAAPAYRQLGQEFTDHQWVDHSSYEYVRGDVTSNQAENYFSQLKRSIDGTHHKLSREHLPRYLSEFDFRYTTRRIGDAKRFEQLAAQMAGRRLSYRSVAGS